MLKRWMARAVVMKVKPMGMLLLAGWINRYQQDVITYFTICFLRYSRGSPISLSIQQARHVTIVSHRFGSIARRG
jgi:hypothetical protein